MLDVLEQFFIYYGYFYLCLDGFIRVEQRQVLMEWFNVDKCIFCFIFLIWSGGVGVNLIGVDIVVFYDSDWNFIMDVQVQDCCY